MTVRYLVVAIDDARPLGPQLACARLLGVPWKLLQALAGGFTVRHLQNLVASSSFCERQSAICGLMVPPHAQPGEGDVMAGLFGGNQSTPWVPAPTPPAPDNSAQEEAARKERLADLKGTGRGATILTDYAMATATPSVLKPTLGA